MTAVDRALEAGADALLETVDCIETNCLTKEIVAATVAAFLKALAADPPAEMVAYGEGYMDMIVPDAVGENTAEGRQREFRSGLRAALTRLAALVETPDAR